MQGGIPYRPKDHPVQEDWESVATKFAVGVKDLIYFNFMTDNPDVVNWYLKNYVGCEKVSPSGNNWMFSNKANPGYIYIPPADDKEVTFDPEPLCTWSPKLEEEFIRRLHALAKGMPGNKGNRIKRLTQVMADAKSGWKDLWYYNDMVMKAFVDWKTPNSERQKSIQSTRGTFPFDGQAVWHTQSPTEAGGEEHSMGMWRIHPVKKMFDDFCNNADASAMKDRLLAIDAEMYKGWYELSLVDARTSQGGGGAYPQIVGDFIDHVTNLSKDKKHPLLGIWQIINPRASRPTDAVRGGRRNAAGRRSPGGPSARIVEPCRAARARRRPARDRSARCVERGRAAAEIGQIEELPLQIARDAVDQAGTKFGIVGKFDGERAEEGSRSQGRSGISNWAKAAKSRSAGEP